jgi:hypothetical protein
MMLKSLYNVFAGNSLTKEVFIHGAALPMTKAAREKSESYDWGYGGHGPRALAHSILAYVFDDDFADAYSLEYRSQVIARLKGDFALPYEDVYAWGQTLPLPSRKLKFMESAFDRFTESDIIGAALLSDTDADLCCKIWATLKEANDSEFADGYSEQSGDHLYMQARDLITWLAGKSINEGDFTLEEAFLITLGLLDSSAFP